MADFDFQRLRSVLTPACQSAFAELRKNHQGESFYCMGLYTSGDFSYLYPTAMTEEGLDQTVLRYQANPRYTDEPVEQLRRSLRWSPCDSPLHREADHHFDEVNVVMQDIVNAVMQDIYATYRSIHTDQEWEEFDDFMAGVENAICEVLESADLAGVFGIGQEREKIFVAIMMGDQDDTILSIGRRLNPPSTFRQFEKEWQQAYQ